MFTQQINLCLTLLSCLSPLVFSDSDDDCFFGKHTPRSPCRSIQVGHQKWTQRGMLSAPSQEKPNTSKGRPKSSRRVEEKNPTKECQGKAQRPRPSVVSGCNSSDDEMDSLLARVKQRMVFPATKSTAGQAGPSGKRPLCTCSESDLAVGVDPWRRDDIGELLA